MIQFIFSWLFSIKQVYCLIKRQLIPLINFRFVFYLFCFIFLYFSIIWLFFIFFVFIYANKFYDDASITFLDVEMYNTWFWFFVYKFYVFFFSNPFLLYIGIDARLNVGFYLCIFFLIFVSFFFIYYNWGVSGNTLVCIFFFFFIILLIFVLFWISMGDTQFFFFQFFSLTRLGLILEYLFGFRKMGLTLETFREDYMDVWARMNLGEYSHNEYVSFDSIGLLHDWAYGDNDKSLVYNGDIFHYSVDLLNKFQVLQKSSTVSDTFGFIKLVFRFYKFSAIFLNFKKKSQNNFFYRFYRYCFSLIFLRDDLSIFFKLFKFLNYLKILFCLFLKKLKVYKDLIIFDIYYSKYLMEQNFYNNKVKDLGIRISLDNEELPIIVYDATLDDEDDFRFELFDEVLLLNSNKVRSEDILRYKLLDYYSKSLLRLGYKFNNYRLPVFYYSWFFSNIKLVKQYGTERLFWSLYFEDYSYFNLLYSNVFLDSSVDMVASQWGVFSKILQNFTSFMGDKLFIIESPIPYFYLKFLKFSEQFFWIEFSVFFERVYQNPKLLFNVDLWFDLFPRLKMYKPNYDLHIFKDYYNLGLSKNYNNLYNYTKRTWTSSNDDYTYTNIEVTDFIEPTNNVFVKFLEFLGSNIFFKGNGNAIASNVKKNKVQLQTFDWEKFAKGFARSDKPTLKFGPEDSHEIYYQPSVMSLRDHLWGSPEVAGAHEDFKFERQKMKDNSGELESDFGLDDGDTITVYGYADPYYFDYTKHNITYDNVMFSYLKKLPIFNAKDSNVYRPFIYKQFGSPIKLPSGRIWRRKYSIVSPWYGINYFENFYFGDGVGYSLDSIKPHWHLVSNFFPFTFNFTSDVGMYFNFNFFNFNYIFKEYFDYEEELIPLDLMYVHMDDNEFSENYANYIFNHVYKVNSEVPSGVVPHDLDDFLSSIGNFGYYDGIYKVGAPWFFFYDRPLYQYLVDSLDYEMQLVKPDEETANLLTDGIFETLNRWFTNMDLYLLAAVELDLKYSAAKKIDIQHEFLEDRLCFKGEGFNIDPFSEFNSMYGGSSAFLMPGNFATSWNVGDPWFLLERFDKLYCFYEEEVLLSYEDMSFFDDYDGVKHSYELDESDDVKGILYYMDDMEPEDSFFFFGPKARLGSTSADFITPWMF